MLTAPEMGSLVLSYSHLLAGFSAGDGGGAGNGAGKNFCSADLMAAGSGASSCEPHPIAARNKEVRMMSFLISKIPFDPLSNFFKIIISVIVKLCKNLNL